MGRTIAYLDEAQPLEGYFVPPHEREQAPGVLLVHTWLGLDEGVKRRAERVAELGYTAFALDVFGPKVHPTPPVESAAVIKPFIENRQLFRQRLEAGLKVLQKQPECDASKVAAIGYCFGGCGVLEMARAGFALKGVVSLHGELATPLPAQPSNIKPKILVLHGDADPRVSQDQVIHFLNEMRQAGSNWEFTAYSGAKHSFTGEGIGGKDDPAAAFNPQAEARSWRAMANFLEEVFQT